MKILLNHSSLLLQAQSSIPAALATTSFVIPTLDRILVMTVPRPFLLSESIESGNIPSFFNS